MEKASSILGAGFPGEGLLHPRSKLHPRRRPPPWRRPPPGRSPPPRRTAPTLVRATFRNNHLRTFGPRHARWLVSARCVLRRLPSLVCANSGANGSRCRDCGGGSKASKDAVRMSRRGSGLCCAVGFSNFRSAASKTSTTIHAHAHLNLSSPITSLSHLLAKCTGLMTGIFLLTQRALQPCGGQALISPL